MRQSHRRRAARIPQANRQVEMADGAVCGIASQIFVPQRRVQLVLTSGRRVYLRFRYLICDLGRLPVDDYLDTRNVVSRILLPLMQYAQERRGEVCLRALEGLIELEMNWDKIWIY